MYHSSDDDGRPVLPPYYYVSNSKEMKNGTALIPRFGSGNLAPPAAYAVLQAAGRFGHLSSLPAGPPCLPLNQSLPPNYFSLHHHQYRQPPLLPLPVSKPQTGSLSGPLNTNTKTWRSDPRKKSKKKKPCRNPAGKEETLKSDNTKVLSPRPGRQVVIKVSSTSSNPVLGLPKHHQLPSNKVSHNVNVISTTSDGCVKEIDEQYDDVVGLDDKFSAGRDRAVFTLSPPPSSLPLPTFSLRPKLRRSAPAAGNPEQRN